MIRDPGFRDGTYHQGNESTQYLVDVANAYGFKSTKQMKLVKYDKSKGSVELGHIEAETDAKHVQLCS